MIYNRAKISSLILITGILFVSGCFQAEEPVPENIPVIPPSTRTDSDGAFSSNPDQPSESK